MADYDFSTLNSSDFEELVCDLLNAHEVAKKSEIIFKTFKEGKDKGIDFLYSTLNNMYEIIGQAKHYYRSGYDALIRVLKNDEKEKIYRLKPNRYIVVTSVDLSVANTQEIKAVFEPFISNLSDIHGKKDLNRYLDLYPEVLERHFKLWFSSTTILKKLLNYEIEGRSNEFKENDLKKRLRLYVETKALSRARNILNKNNFVIITGEPGSGKTITAELLIYELLKDDYQLVYIYDDIKEAEKTLNEKPTKQVFYFDDFLGSNSLEIIKAKGSETALLKILRRISHLQNKKFVFTTRTFLLNTAIEESEKLRKFNLKAEESMIQLSDYDISLKLHLLNNHIEESNLRRDLKAVLLQPEIQNFIVKHENFSPRSVEYITFSENLENLSSENFEAFIKNNFNNPAEIWRHAYEQQINDVDRFLLNTLMSFGDSAEIDQLEIAFDARLDYEVTYNNYQRPMYAFRNAFKRLENGFIIQQTHDYNKVKFLNPSLVDFLLNYLRNDRDEKIRISLSAVFLTQLTTRFLPLEFSEVSTIPDRLREKLLSEYSIYIKASTVNADKFALCILFYYYFEPEKTESNICDLILSIDNWSFFEDRENKYYSIIFLEKVVSEKVINTISSLGLKIFEPLLLHEFDIEKSIELMEFIKNKFKIDLITIFQRDEYYHFSTHFSNLLDEKIEEDIEDLLDYSNAHDFVSEKEEESIKLKQRLEEFGLDIKANFSEYGGYNWWEIGMDNYLREQMAKDD